MSKVIEFPKHDEQAKAICQAAARAQKFARKAVCSFFLSAAAKAPDENPASTIVGMQVGFLITIIEASIVAEFNKESFMAMVSDLVDEIMDQDEDEAPP